MENRIDAKEASYDFLRVKGFKIKKEESSGYFGDYYSIWVSKAFRVRFVQDKLVQSIDISSVGDKDAWYDLALVKGLINNENKLNITSPIPELINFMKEHFSDIETLFNKKNYPETKHKLDELGIIRARQISPNLNI